MITQTIPVFTVRDLAKTVEWYRDVLGFQPISNGIRSSENTVLMTRDRVEVLFKKQVNYVNTHSKSWSAYFRLTGVDTLYDKIKGRAEILSGPTDTVHHDREIEVRDPNGYLLAFGEWDKKKDEKVSLYDVHPVLPVTDILETVHWYKSTLDFKGEPWQRQPPYLFAMLYKDRVETFFAKSPNFESSDGQPQRWAVYFRLVGQQIQELYDGLKEKVTVVRELDRTFTGYSEFEIADNNGHVLCFSEMT